MRLRFRGFSVDIARPSHRLIEGLRGPGPVAVLTGAGISAESGLDTFRGAGGLWEGRDPMSLATPEAFSRDPCLVWRFYSWRRGRAAAADPNPGHLALAAFGASLPDFRLITQNVDGLHERAGSRRVARLHGSLWTLRCTAEGTEAEDLRADLGPLPPVCACGAVLRPGVVWFGEALPTDALSFAVEAARKAKVFLVVGTSGLVHPAASLPLLARQSGAYVVEINPEPTPLTAIAHERMEGPSGSILPVLACAAGIPVPGSA